MSKAVRSRVVEDFVSRYEAHRHLVLVDYRGLTSAQASSLRSSLRADKIKVTVLKNSSARLAFERIGWKDLTAYVEGPTAVIYGVDDPILISKRVVEWKKKNKALEVRGGLVDGKAVPAKIIEQFSAMPGREQILANVVGAIQAPLTGFVGTLHGVLRQFVGTVDAIADKKKAAGA